MDDFRSQYLESLDATARAQEALIERARTVLRNPKQHEWETIGQAAVAFPLAAVGAALTELQRALVSGSLEPQVRGEQAS